MSDTPSQALAYVKGFLLELLEKCPEVAKHADIIAFVKNEVNPALVHVRQLECEVAELREENDKLHKAIDHRDLVLKLALEQKGNP